MSHDEKTSRAFAAMSSAVDVGIMSAALEVLAKEVAELKGLDFESEGEQIVAQAVEEGRLRVMNRSMTLTRQLLHGASDDDPVGDSLT